MLAGVGPEGTSTCLGGGDAGWSGLSTALVSSSGAVSPLGGFVPPSGAGGTGLGADDCLTGALFWARGVAAAGLESLEKNATMAPTASTTPPPAATDIH